MFTGDVAEPGVAVNEERVANEDSAPRSGTVWMALVAAGLGASIGIIVGLVWQAVETSSCADDLSSCLGPVVLGWGVGVVVIPLGSWLVLRQLGVPWPLAVAAISLFVSVPALRVDGPESR